jgi:hypothetical protein
MLKLHEPEGKGMSIKDYEDRVRATARVLKWAMAERGLPAKCQDATVWISKARELVPTEFGRYTYAVDALQFFKDVVRIEALTEEQKSAVM